jgi:hypothetical protein
MTRGSSTRLRAGAPRALLSLATTSRLYLDRGVVGAGVVGKGWPGGVATLLVVCLAHMRSAIKREVRLGGSFLPARATAAPTHLGGYPADCPRMDRSHEHHDLGGAPHSGASPSLAGGAGGEYVFEAAVCRRR